MKTRKITLLRNKRFAIVDADDYQRLIEMCNWGLWSSPATKQCYASGNVRGKTTGMHRAVLRAKSGQIVDHINGNGLDNRKANLRFTTRAGNVRNQRRVKNLARNTSLYKGVTFRRDRPDQIRRWEASIAMNGIHKYLGAYDSEVEAARAYNMAAQELHGEFASLNIIPKKLEKNLPPWAGFSVRDRDAQSSKYRGVHKTKAKNCRLKPWRVSIMVNGKRIQLGGYPTEKEAARVYRQKAKELLGKDAKPRLNQKMISLPQR